MEPDWVAIRRRKNLTGRLMEINAGWDWERERGPEMETNINF